MLVQCESGQVFPMTQSFADTIDILSGTGIPQILFDT